MMNSLTEAMIEQFQRNYDADCSAQSLTAACAKTDLKDLAYVPMNAAKLDGAFAIDLKVRGITAQQKSGRCWEFAALNILREKTAEKLNLKEFEFSQNYISFYDKLEKANNFLEMAIANAEEPLSGQQMDYLLREGIGDGGYWGQAVDLIRKYGLVPKYVMPETYQSEHTASFMDLLNRLLKKDAAELREMVLSGKDPQARKTVMLNEIYRAECIAFGKPVFKFDFEYRDEKNEYHAVHGLTPKKFYETYVGDILEDYAAFINEPVSDRPMNAPVSFHSNGNMADHDLTACNISIDDLEDLCVKQLKKGEPVWFACDAGAYGARKEGIWDPASMNYEGILGGIDLSMQKKERLEYKASAATHAMVLTGVNFSEDGRPNRWKIENSWGEENGKKGFYTASEAYFREFVYEAVILKSCLSEEQKEMLRKEPVRINAWEEE